MCYMFVGVSAIIFVPTLAEKYAKYKNGTLRNWDSTEGASTAVRRVSRHTMSGVTTTLQQTAHDVVSLRPSRDNA